MIKAAPQDAIADQNPNQPMVSFMKGEKVNEFMDLLNDENLLL